MKAYYVRVGGYGPRDEIREIKKLARHTRVCTIA